VWSCLEGVCINAGVDVDGAAGQKKENRVCIDINRVVKVVVDSTVDVMMHSEMPHSPDS
jgi:hypothetical protein